MPEPNHPPLKAAWFHILLALSDGAQHGFAIRERVEERTDGSVKLWPATLYGSIRDLVTEGAIEALEGEPDDDQRRHYYRLTPAGRDLLRAEADRLQALVDAARGSRALAKA
jgi:DNA-binding PadR family transcriptional regulator